MVCALVSASTRLRAWMHLLGAMCVSPHLCTHAPQPVLGQVNPEPAALVGGVTYRSTAIIHRV